VSEDRTLVIDLAYLTWMREWAAEHHRPVLAEGIGVIINQGITVNLPARQLAAIAETLRPIVETDWQERRQEADLTPSGVNG
jgi:hypothetical protein